MLICSSIDEHLGCFRFLAVLNEVGMNIHVQVLVWLYVLISLGYTSRCGIPGSRDNSRFNCLRNHQTFSNVLHHFTFLPAIYEGSGFSASLTTLIIVFFIIAILVGVP